MNRLLFHITVAALLLAMMSSCVDPISDNWQEPVPEIADDAMVTLTFGVPQEIITKSFGDKPQNLETMHVFLFNKDGMLLVAKKATRFVSVSDNGISAAKHWSVDLPMGTAERHIHFVANLGSAYIPPTTGSENVLMRSITTKNGRDAYWQRVILRNGISAYKYDGSGSYTYCDPDDGIMKTRDVEDIDGFKSMTNTSYTYEYTDTQGITREITVNSGDYIKVNGTKVLDGTGLYASKETSEKVAMIPLVRNFARIRLTNSTTSNFKVIKAVLVNAPMAGFVAPFDDREGENSFVTSYLNAGTTSITHQSVLQSGYPATIPSAGVDKHEPSETECQGGDELDEETPKIIDLYMYERGIPSSDATAVLVKGKLTPSNGDEPTPCWFKIDITDPNGEYFPIYRGCTYNMTINSINVNKGYPTISKAFSSSSIGDISSSPETATLTRIDDGRGVELWVEYIDFTSIGDVSSVGLLYKFTYTTGNTTRNYTNKVIPTLKSYGSSTFPAVINTSSQPLAGSTYSGTDTPDGKNGWYKSTIYLDGVGEGIIKRSYIHFEGTVTTAEVGHEKTLHRDVTFRVLPKQEFELLKTTGLENDSSGQETTLRIELPQNVLGYSVFPLTLLIEAKNNCLTPVDNIPVETGKSAFSTTTNPYNSFYFLKTINYSEYQQSNVFTCKFKTTKDSGNVPTTIRVTDRRGIFVAGTVDLKVGTDSTTYPSN